MKKYLTIVKNSLGEHFAYRVDFYLSRVASIVQLLAVFLLWRVFLGSQEKIFTYESKQILTYVLLAALLRNLIFAIKSKDIAGQIASGDLNQYLLKPISYTRMWFARDLAVKASDLIWGFVEIAIVIVIFGVSLFWQQDLFYLLFFILSTVLAIILYFALSFLVSLTTFWYFEHSGWPARFLFEVTTTFLSGLIFPLDIIKPQLRGIFLLLPQSFLIYHPLQIYLGKVSKFECFQILLGGLVWLLVSWLAGRFVWKKGLIRYEAFSG